MSSESRGREPDADLEGLVAFFLEGAEPHWACRPCIVRTLELSLREVKIALLRFGRTRGRGYVETSCDVCEGCGVRTAVVRLGRRGRWRLIA